MGVVNRKMLNRHMSEPRWTTAQEAEADRVCEAVEADLSAALYGAPITPVDCREVAGVTREGMVATSLPIAQLLTLGELVIYTDETPGGTPTNLPAGWTLRGGWLWTPPAASDTFGVPWWGEQRSYGGGPFYTGQQVAISYLGGWGNEPTIVEAILRKARVRMAGRHSDTIVVTGLNGQAANREPNESPNFTDEDMKTLGRFRNLGWAGPGR